MNNRSGTGSEKVDKFMMDKFYTRNFIFGNRSGMSRYFFSLSNYTYKALERCHLKKISITQEKIIDKTKP